MLSSRIRCMILFGIAGLSVHAAEPAVIEAVRSGDLEELRRIIARKDGVRALGSRNQTALHEAASRCNVEAAEALLQAGLDRSALDDAGLTPGELAFTCRNGAAMSRLVRLLYIPRPKKAAAVSGARWTLQDAAARGDANVAEMLLKLGADVNGVNGNGDRALELACRKGDARMVEILLGRGADVKLASSSGTNALHEAALGGAAPVVELLIQHGAAVDAADQEKAATPLHYAASFGRLEAAKALLLHGADVRRKDRNGRDALALAVENGHTAVADLLRSAIPPTAKK